MDDMQAVYDDEANRGFGLMSLLRAPLDIALDPSIMDNLPDILSAVEKSSALEKAIRRGGTDQEMLEMKIESIDAQDPDESSLSVQLSNAPGILSLLDEAGYGTAATMLGMTGAGGKGKSFKELIDEIQRLAGRMASDKDMDATRYANEANLPDFLKSFSQKKKERTDKEMYEQRPSRNMPRDPDLDKGLGSLDPMMEDAVKKAENIRNPSYVIEEMQDTVDSFGRGVKSKKYIPAARTREQGEKALARLSEREQMQIRALRDQHRKAMQEVFGTDRSPISFEKEQQILERLSELDKKLEPYFTRSDLQQMAEGGRPGLWANIHAKRKRIKSGSGEKMRSPGSKGAPTKENFKQARSTTRKANGGGLGYAKGYYGKSYK